jgi:hypothetical protein
VSHIESVGYQWVCLYASELIIDNQSILAEINENGPQCTDTHGKEDRSSENYDVGVV